MPRPPRWVGTLCYLVAVFHLKQEDSNQPYMEDGKNSSVAINEYLQNMFARRLITAVFFGLEHAAPTSCYSCNSQRVLRMYEQLNVSKNVSLVVLTRKKKQVSSSTHMRTFNRLLVRFLSADAENNWKAKYAKKTTQQQWHGHSKAVVTSSTSTSAGGLCPLEASRRSYMPPPPPYPLAGGARWAEVPAAEPRRNVEGSPPAAAAPLAEGGDSGYPAWFPSCLSRAAGPLAMEAGPEGLWVLGPFGGSHVTALPLWVAGLTVREADAATLVFLATGLNLEAEAEAVAALVGGTMGSCLRASAA